MSGGSFNNQWMRELPQVSEIDRMRSWLTEIQPSGYSLALELLDRLRSDVVNFSNSVIEAEPTLRMIEYLASGDIGEKQFHDVINGLRPER